METDANLEAIRDWLQKQPHLPQTLDDRLLARFLNSCDSSLALTKTTLELFFTLRADCPDVFSDRDPSSPRIQEVLRRIDLLPLEGLTPQGYSCFIVRFTDIDPATFLLSDLMKTIFLVGDLQIRAELDRVPQGLVVVVDARGWSLKLIPKLSITAVKKYFDYCQKAQPVRAREVHVINPLPFMDKILSVFRPYMKSNVLEMIQIHPEGSESFYRFVPKEILPKEYGGHTSTVKDIKDRWNEKIAAEREWLLTNEWMADDSKRESKRKGEQRSDMEGSFRSLSID